MLLRRVRSRPHCPRIIPRKQSPLGRGRKHWVRAQPLPRYSFPPVEPEGELESILQHVEEAQDNGRSRRDFEQGSDGVSPRHGWGVFVVGYESSGTIRSRDTAGIPFGAVSELGAGERLAGGGDAMVVMRWRQLATD